MSHRWIVLKHWLLYGLLKLFGCASTTPDWDALSEDPAYGPLQTLLERCFAVYRPHEWEPLLTFYQEGEPMPSAKRLHGTASGAAMFLLLLREMKAHRLPPDLLSEWMTAAEIDFHYRLAKRYLGLIRAGEGWPLGYFYAAATHVLRKRSQAQTSVISLLSAEVASLAAHSVSDKKYARAGGGVWIMTIGVMVVVLCLSSIAVDMGFYLASQNRLQTAADAASLAGTHKLFTGTAVTAELRRQDASDEAVAYGQVNHPDLLVKSGDIEFGFIDPTTLQYNAATFTTPSASADYKATGGYNAMRVTTRMDDAHGGALPTIFANLFNTSQMQPAARSVAVMDNKIGSVVAGGLRPIYGCNAQHALAMDNAQNKGMPLDSQVVRIYGDHFELNGQSQSCVLPGPGNWGFADFRDCDPGSPGNSTVSDWFANGYPGSIQLGQCYSTAPGNFLKSNEVQTALDNLISHKTIVLIPLVENFTGTGSQTSVTIVGYTGFVFTNVFTDGSQDNWYVEGYYTRATCTTECQGNPASIGGGVAKLRLIR